MPLVSLFKRDKADAAAARTEAPSDDEGPVQQARVQARRRLIGAVVLLALGLVLFPLVFESKPRPLPRDLPIELSRRDSGPVVSSAAPPPTRAASPRGVPPPSDAGSETATPATPAAQPVASAASPAVRPAPATAVAREVPAQAPSSAPRADPKPAHAQPPAVEPPRQAPEPKRDAAPEAVRATAPEPSASDPKAARYVVQVGAFTDAGALREARQKVEKLGLKTYTQVVETAAGARTRVRVGPFDTRQEAERAGARLKEAGLPAYLLAL